MIEGECSRNDACSRTREHLGPENPNPNNGTENQGIRAALPVPLHTPHARQGRWRLTPWERLLRRVQQSARAQSNTGMGTQQKRSGHRVILNADDLERQFERQRGRCYWLGVKLDPPDVFKKWTPLAMGVDRLNNDWGYFPANIVITCRFANLGRADTPTKLFIPQIRKLRKMIAGEMWPHYLFDEQPPFVGASDSETDERQD